MAGTLSVAVVTPERQVVSAPADMVVAPSVLGQIGILPGHAPLLADLGPGVVELRAGAQAEQFFVSGGFVEVDQDRVTVLVDSAEAVGSIDVARARDELQDAEAKLTKLDGNSPEYAAEGRRAERARQRLQAARPAS
jgi:F-type H+-transporting ATPase subunit epsilon